MAELYGKIEGCSHGYGGSMHLYDVERGNLGANAVVGGGLPAIVGAALAFKLRGEPRVAVAFFGDGATNIGTFHEALNLAQLWKVPAVFVSRTTTGPSRRRRSSSCRSPTSRSARSPSACSRRRSTARTSRRSTRRPGAALDARARAGKGPVFLVVRDVPARRPLRRRPAGLPSEGRVRELRETQDPIEQLRARLGIPDESSRRSTREAIEMVEASVEFAKTGTDPKPEDALKNVYA